MKKEIKGVNINYVDYGNPDGDTFILLHGWGQNIDMMKPVGNAFQKDMRVIIVDLPGFGASEEPKSVWTIYDYADCIHELLKSLKTKNITMLGHSFGGKVSLAYASKYELNKLVILAAPFKKEIVKESFKTKMLKTFKKIPLLNKLEGFAKKHIGSTDYKNASPMMREILVEHVNLDITEDIKKIKVPTFIIWGESDQAVSIERAHELENLIDNAGLAIFPGTHYAYLENLKRTITTIRIFIEG